MLGGDQSGSRTYDERVAIVAEGVARAQEEGGISPAGNPVALATEVVAVQQGIVSWAARGWTSTSSGRRLAVSPTASSLHCGDLSRELNRRAGTLNRRALRSRQASKSRGSLCPLARNTAQIVG
ncbi:hypothetical protein Acsp02_55810 [Actinoplanes sp. NBRC 103695]|nr:hypothetical protein Acsp02_55810 [Actinoplanes sp. NBRC 103695]